jgi:catechol 2,3-dioxygenase-like lactoylglutathione lyase family enzyme
MPQQSLSSCSAFPGPFERSSFWEFLIFMMKTNKQRHRETFESAGRAMRALGNPRLAPARRLRRANVLFIASVAVIAADPPRSRKLFIDALGLPLKGEGDGYYSSGSIPGCKHFGVWPLSQAAEACFGTPKWPADRIIPQASIEFEVKDADTVAVAGGELQRAGFELLHPARTEPWGQTVARFLTEDGLILGISYIPSFHKKETA